MTNEQALVRAILEKATSYTWYFNGLGFMFTRLEGDRRLHVHHLMFQVEGTGKIHNHYWSFASTILAGSLSNYSYIPSDNGTLYDIYRLPTTGIAELVEETESMLSLHNSVHSYGVGERYYQSYEDLHGTRATNGTVTLLERNRNETPSDFTVIVCVEHGKEYVKWDEREVTNIEIVTSVQSALELLK